MIETIYIEKQITEKFLKLNRKIIEFKKKNPLLSLQKK